MINKKQEYIICAAIWFHDGIKYPHQPLPVEEGFVVCGRRHHNCYMTVSAIKSEDVKDTRFFDDTQGFLTNLDRFVKRDEAGIIACLSGQIDKPTECLFSEDLY